MYVGTPSVLLWSAALLSIERVCYIWITRAPEKFRAVCARTPFAGAELLTVLRTLFYGFKILQLAVFAGWCYVYSGGSLWPLGGEPMSSVVGASLIAAGQLLNASVFYRLGHVGVLYGNSFGWQVPWCRQFPFSLLPHPQYVGVVLSIWGFFLAVRFPHSDWFFLPMLETTYYALGAHFER